MDIRLHRLQRASKYPNLVALFDHLGVPTKPSNMGFSVSLDDGRIEYGGDSLPALFAQWRNLVRPRFWSMLADLVRFYREAPLHACALDHRMTSLGDYLNAQGYGRAFQDDHLLPQAAAIWSASVNDIRAYPAAAFIRFCENHGLLKIIDRPLWRTVEGGSRAYVSRLAAAYADKIHCGETVTSIPARRPRRAGAHRHCGDEQALPDHLVIATHADQGLALLDDAAPNEREIMGAYAYCRNLAVLHSDPALMPKRRATWSAWNYIGRGGDEGLCVTYWMNPPPGPAEQARLCSSTLNPVRPPDPVPRRPHRGL